MNVNALLLHRGVKPLFFGLAVVPLGSLVWAAAYDQLGANPAEFLVRATGDWTLRMLCLALALTPLRLSLGLAALARFRRMAGLFVYFYATLHLLAYAWFDMGFDVGDVVRDIAKRPFIWVGFSAFGLLTIMALTSFNLAIKILGGKAWKRLHQLVYLVAVLAILHFFWMRTGKNDFAEVLVYAALLAGMLGWRLHHAMSRINRWKAPG